MHQVECMQELNAQSNALLTKCMQSTNRSTFRMRHGQKYTDVTDEPAAVYI
jgi:hypothetical protein